MAEYELPAGWQQSLTVDGRPFYIDHDTHTTHWHAPPVATAEPSEHALKTLRREFPSWEDEALTTVLDLNGGNEGRTRQHILTWTEQDAAPRGAVPNSEPVMLARPHYDAVMARRLASGLEPKSIKSFLKAVDILKRRAKFAKAVSGAMHTGETVARPKDPPTCDGVSRSREDKIAAGKVLLGQRLSFLRLANVHMADDGNCLFRAMSYELFNSQAYHHYVRDRVVKHLQTHSSTYEPFVGDHGAFTAYIHDMTQDASWGDELCLQACCDAFRVDIHVITTDSEHFHLAYAPGGPPPPHSHTATTPHRKLFLSYIAPVHYNVVAPAK